MGLINLVTLAMATGAFTSTFFGSAPASSAGGNVVIATTVVTVTSVVKGPPATSEISIHSLPGIVVTSTPIVTVPVQPVPSDPLPLFNISTWEPSDLPSEATTGAEPETTISSPYFPMLNSTLVVSGTANSSSHFGYGTPAGSAIATKTTGPDSGVGMVKASVAAGLAALAVAVLGA